MEAKKFEISETVLNAIFNNLAQQPYKVVADLIEAIKQDIKPKEQE
nr:hypothetical protein [uncultured Draconibacterium sp.]